jgi:hypothetical protein
VRGVGGAVDVAGAAAAFATALDEVLGPLTGGPRYIVPRYTLPVADSRARERARARSLVLGRPLETVATFHAVPALLARNREGAVAFQRAWNRWVGGGEVVYTLSPVGREVLAAHYGTEPVEVSTGHRTAWA